MFSLDLMVYTEYLLKIPRLMGLIFNIDVWC